VITAVAPRVKVTVKALEEPVIVNIWPGAASGAELKVPVPDVNVGLDTLIREILVACPETAACVIVTL
jgi:hypothetical protein